jgi:hypothetical protein
MRREKVFAPGQQKKEATAERKLAAQQKIEMLASSLGSGSPCQIFAFPTIPFPKPTTQATPQPAEPNPFLLQKFIAGAARKRFSS